MPLPTQITVVPEDGAIRIAWDDDTARHVRISAPDWPDLASVAGCPFRALQWIRGDVRACLETPDYEIVPIDDPEGIGPLITAVMEAYSAQLAAEEASRPAPTATAAEVADEAERRIAEGIIVDGYPFRTDDITLGRLNHLLMSFEAGSVPARGVTYARSGGPPICWTRIAQVRAMFTAASQYVSDVLERSAAHQAAPPTDLRADRHWPVRPRVAVNV